MWSLSKLLNFFNINFYKCFWRYVQGVKNIPNQKFNEAIDDFNWVLENGAFSYCEYVLFRDIGICYAYLENFKKAEVYLKKTLEYSQMKKDGELHQWLGYVHCVNGEYDDAIKCFRKAFNLGQRGINSKLVNQKYVKEQILQLNKIMKEKDEGTFSSFE